MGIRAHFAGIVTNLVVTAGACDAAQAEPLRVRYNVWPGHGPLFFAREKGWFEKEGIEIELIEMEEHTAAFAGLAAGQVDAILGSPPDGAAFSQPGEEPRACVLATDESFGGDGVLATTDISSIADLKGKSVAFLHGSISQFYINVLLKEAGLTEADIEVVDLTAEDAVTALQLQEVDAAVTWQPWLTQGKAAEHVHVLTDSSQQPGLLVDCLMTTASVFQDRKSEFQALARIWFEAVEYVEAHPEEAMPIMARHMGGGLDDPEAFAKTLETIRFFDREGHRVYLGTPESPGPIYQAAQHAINVYSDLGVLTFKLSPSDLVIHGILEE
jgi:NitT/TauT family transport system substrate-binding protein